MAVFNRLAMCLLVLGYQMDLMMVGTASSLLYSCGGAAVKAMLIIGFLCYTAAVLIVGLINLADLHEPIFTIAGAATSVLAALFIMIGLAINTSKVGQEIINEVAAYQTTVYSISLIFAALAGGILIFEKMQSSDEPPPVVT